LLDGRGLGMLGATSKTLGQPGWIQEIARSENVAGLSNSRRQEARAASDVKAR
jgi:hypothetical protein